MAPLTNQITVIPNPAVKDTPREIPNVPDSVKNNSHIHLKFGVTGNRQLSLQVYDTTNIVHPTEYTDNKAPTGSIHEPGTLAGAVHNNIAVVYGIAGFASKDTGKASICKLSPYYNPIAKANPASEEDQGPIQTNLWSLTACDDGDEGNWVYFLRNQGTETDPNIVLVELEIGLQDQAVERPLDVDFTIGAKSRLTSFYEKAPYVFFVHEEDDRGIYFVNATKTKAATQINDTMTVKESSPLAIVTNASTNTNNEVTLQLTLYFVNLNGYLAYVLGTLDNGYITWQDGHQSLANIHVDQTSSLCAISGADNKTHYIYLVPKGNPAGAYQVHRTTPWQVSPPHR
ncbi:hypothetical protein BDV26DRAFT_289827 [Aspergillus bertholletiae]|uniref:Fucose-specific lectin n=1 Tax=Aspergillus bertholletiae TaxID=1226010 RepID=A0A5N7BH88_9EURO|nr:hypothetical protein BDV26DRAFT_289827 [Aspergillus bertholletiae]